MSLLSFMVVDVEGKFDFVLDWHCKKMSGSNDSSFPEVAEHVSQVENVWL